MIHHSQFIWTHIGRTGGYSVDKMFRILNRADVYLDPIDATFSDWKRHQTYEQRAEEMEEDWLVGKKRILNIRRLPNWVLSFAEFKKKYQKIPFTHENLVQVELKAEGRNVASGTMDAQYQSFKPDDMLSYYGYDTVDYWLRTEYLTLDFIETFGNYCNITEPEKIAIGQVFENSNAYAKNIRNRFTNDELKNMYELSPIWASLEQKIYGNLLIS